MSHNKIKIAGQSPNVSSEVNLNIADIGSFTSTTNKQLGFNASGDLVQLDQPPSSGFKWIPTYHYFSIGYPWGGGGALTVGGSLGLRKPNNVLYKDASYVTDFLGTTQNHATWANVWQLQPGTYLLNATFMGRITTASDHAVIRWQNMTDSIFIGNHASYGASQYSCNAYAYVNISTAKKFNFSVRSIAGTPWVISYITEQSIHFNIWRLA